MLIYGKNTVKEAITAKRVVYIVYLDEKTDNRLIMDILNKKKIEVKLVSKHELNKLTNDGLHQGIAALVADYELFSLTDILDKNYPHLVILDKISDPHNFGAIIRTAEAAGVKGIIVPKKSQTKISPTVCKIASGAMEYVKIIEVANLNQAVKRLKENGYWIIGSAADADQSFKSIVKPDKIALIVGSEGFGMSYMLKQACDYLVKIPMLGKANSLNASVAAALLIYQMKGLI